LVQFRKQRAKLVKVESGVEAVGFSRVGVPTAEKDWNING